jgi:hypothetical protein
MFCKLGGMEGEVGNEGRTPGTVLAWPYHSIQALARNVCI